MARLVLQGINLPHIFKKYFCSWCNSQSPILGEIKKKKNHYPLLLSSLLLCLFSIRTRVGLAGKGGADFAKLALFIEVHSQAPAQCEDLSIVLSASSFQKPNLQRVTAGMWG